MILIAAENLRQLLVSLPRRSAAVAQNEQAPPDRRGRKNSGMRNGQVTSFVPEGAFGP